MNTARRFFNYLNRLFFDKMGFRIIVASSTKESQRKAREMKSDNSIGWVSSPFYPERYTIREDSIDHLYDFYLEARTRTRPFYFGKKAKIVKIQNQIRKSA